MRRLIFFLATILLLCGLFLTLIGLNSGCDFFTIVGLVAIFCFVLTVVLEIKGQLK